MKEEARYGEEEVRAIFRAAAEAGEAAGAPERAAGAGEGLTLAELQEIGREVGIRPDAVAAAARSVGIRPAPAPRRTLLGLPVAVERTVPLPRAPTEREWAMLVAELRATFRARGRVESLGDLREWRNGNLHACVEPVETGYRLRLGTLKGGAAGSVTLGAVGLTAGLATLATAAVPPLSAALITLWGGLLASRFLGLPRWAAQRERQMEHIAARAEALTAAPAET